MSRWYISEAGARQGPFSTNEFFACLQNKDLSRVLVWREGMTAWVPAKSVPGLAKLVTANADPSMGMKRKRARYRPIALLAGAASSLAVLAAIGWLLFPSSEKPRADIPPFSIRVMRDGTEAVISGGIRPRLADDLATILNASRHIKVVHLDSVGGDLGEAIRLSRLVREKALNTYVHTQCLSVCTVAFASGRQRFLAEGAKLGFETEREPLSSDQYHVAEAFSRAGFSSAFLDRLSSLAPGDVWTPTDDLLQSEGVITAIVSRRRFAFSDFSDQHRGRIADLLGRAFQFFEVMQRKFPSQYDDVVNEFSDAIRSERADPAAAALMIGRVMTIVKALLPLADDGVLSALNDVLIEKYVSLNERNPSHCYAYASGTPDPENIVLTLPDDLLKREADLYIRAIETASARSAPETGRLAGLQTFVRQRLAERGVSEERWKLVVESTNLDTAMHAEFCSMTIMLFQEIASLPNHDRVTVMRAVMGGN